MSILRSCYDGKANANDVRRTGFSAIYGGLLQQLRNLCSGGGKQGGKAKGYDEDTYSLEKEGRIYIQG